MADRDRIEVDMSHGMQPPSAFGDRVLVGLALLVLVVGGIIALGNALPDADEIGQASSAPTSGPTHTPRPTATPAPPRVATIQPSDADFSPQPQTYTFNGWVRALHDLVVRETRSPDGRKVALLKQGDLAYASQQDESDVASGWLYLDDPAGWIAGVVDGVDQVRRYDYPRYRSSGGITSLIAGPDGFAAIVVPPGGPDSYPPGEAAFSSDGSSWQSDGESFFDSWGGGFVAWGPAGWLGASTVDDGIGPERILIWSSSDALHWTRLGALGGGAEGEFATQLLGSDDGYLLETVPVTGGGSPTDNSLWSSTDGQTWLESTDPVLSHPIFGERRIAALHHGFYLWDTGHDPIDRHPFAAFSAGGQTWSELVSRTAPDGLGLQVVDTESGIIGIDLSPTSLVPRVWSSVLDGGQLSWIRESASDRAFDGGLVRTVVSDGTRAYAFGWDATTDAPLVWTGNGRDWIRTVLPSAFGGIPQRAAAGPAGVVVVGQRQTLRGPNPIIWHRTAAGQWLPESDPILEAVPDPTTECSRPPSDVLEYGVVDSAAVIACQGATPFTFRAFSVECSNCWGHSAGNPQPAWLFNPTINNLLFLAPSREHPDWMATVVLGPSLEKDSSWTGSWIEITGHYDDPAALTCRQDVTADSVQWWTGLSSLVEQCRETFVVSKVQVVDGP
jgi:hypothetical protein